MAQMAARWRCGGAFFPFLETRDEVSVSNFSGDGIFEVLDLVKHRQFHDHLAGFGEYVGKVMLVKKGAIDNIRCYRI
jgi:hypothetical protein